MRASRRITCRSWSVLLDREHAFHPGGGVAGDGALEGVAPLPQEGDPQRVRLPMRDERGLPAVDLEVVLERSDIRDLEDDDAAPRAFLAEHELELARDDLHPGEQLRLASGGFCGA